MRLEPAILRLEKWVHRQPDDVHVKKFWENMNMRIASEHMILGLLLELCYEEKVLRFNPQRLTLCGIIPRRVLCENPSTKGERRKDEVGASTYIGCHCKDTHMHVEREWDHWELNQRRWSGFELVILKCLLMLIPAFGFYWRSKSTFGILVLLLFLGMMHWDGIS